MSRIVVLGLLAAILLSACQSTPPTPASASPAAQHSVADQASGFPAGIYVGNGVEVRTMTARLQLDEMVFDDEMAFSHTLVIDEDGLPTYGNDGQLREGMQRDEDFGNGTTRTQTVEAVSVHQGEIRFTGSLDTTINDVPMTGDYTFTYTLLDDGTIEMRTTSDVFGVITVGDLSGSMSMLSAGYGILER